MQGCAMSTRSVASSWTCWWRLPNRYQAYWARVCWVAVLAAAPSTLCATTRLIRCAGRLVSNTRRVPDCRRALMFAGLRVGPGVREGLLFGLFFDNDMVGARFYGLNHFGHAAQGLFKFPGLLVKRAQFGCELAKLPVKRGQRLLLGVQDRGFLRCRGQCGAGGRVSLDHF